MELNDFLDAAYWLSTSTFNISARWSDEIDDKTQHMVLKCIDPASTLILNLPNEMGTRARFNTDELAVVVTREFVSDSGGMLLIHYKLDIYTSDRIHIVRLEKQATRDSTPTGLISSFVEKFLVMY